MKFSVVIVTFNSRQLMDRCLEPVVKSIGSDLEVIIWDNNSLDDTCAYVSERYPQVRLYRGEKNIGFAAGNNAAFAHCRGDYILLLNPDAFLDSAAQIWALAGHLERSPDVAAVGPMLGNADGSHQVGDAGWAHTLRNCVGHFLFLHRLSPHFQSIYLTNPALFQQDAVDVDWICGACLLVRKSVLADVGGLDESIFMYGEDAQWGERMRRAGRRLLYVPGIRVLHLQGGTQKAEEKARFTSKKWIDALARHISANSSRLEFSLFKMVLSVGFLLRMAGYLVVDVFKKGDNFERFLTMRDYAAHSFLLKRTETSFRAAAPAHPQNSHPTRP